MRLGCFFGALFLTVTGISAQDVSSQDLSRDVWQLESRGEAMQAHERLRKAAEAAPNNPAVLRAYCDYLDRHRDPATREAYEKFAQVLARTAGSPDERVRVARRLTVLDLLAGDQAAA